MARIKSVCLAQLKFAKGTRDQTYSQMWQVLLAVTWVTWHWWEHRPICSSSCTISRAQKHLWFCHLPCCLCVIHTHAATVSTHANTHVLILLAVTLSIIVQVVGRKHTLTSTWDASHICKKQLSQMLGSTHFGGSLQQMCLRIAGGSGGHNVRMVTSQL